MWDDFVVLVHGTRSDAEALKVEIGALLADRLRMTLSDEKTHIDDGFVFLGFHMRRRPSGEGRRVVPTIPAKPALASVMHKIKQLTGRGTTSRSLTEVLRTVNPVLRGWAAYFRYGASKKTFSHLGWYAWWRLLHRIRHKHPRLTWKQLRRRYYGADRITEGGLVLCNPAKMRVERYRFRGAQISTPYNIDEVNPDGARFRRTSHDDAAFVGCSPAAGQDAHQRLPSERATPPARHPLRPVPLHRAVPARHRSARPSARQDARHPHQRRRRLATSRRSPQRA
ncbi:group II intron maturase-specific domain-containing protein [Saccharothrix deserti]|uniref:group II intron maturase-specific domain-containing protein n=1 Tax=Saccharothrix deserti TaxID=2593674 RepID=UPI00192E63FA|nr:group II intron maturase-specific domain-containing protein [Saccharothrix deserti]